MDCTAPMSTFSMFTYLELYTRKLIWIEEFDDKSNNGKICPNWWLIIKSSVANDEFITMNEITKCYSRKIIWLNSLWDRHVKYPWMRGKTREEIKWNVQKKPRPHEGCVWFRREVVKSEVCKREYKKKEIGDK